ncbi:MAG: bacillithiol biosynthesis cysteine-adding enzyme BshC [Bacteroidetes bacterium]|nr:bacillithiol biosynthesis cysteine-adding enzyme BshC [Bacteroidota bacterium]
MTFSAQHTSYSSTGFFSKLVADYLQQEPALLPFIAHAPTTDGVKAAIANRKKYPTNRKALVEVLRKQYAQLTPSAAVENNINKLLDENTFTITTAHQPNILTGPLYFIYKILHAVKLAATLTEQLPGNYFVPVYYMGSEDADLDELGHIYLNGEKYEWQTKQTGAVGRMKVDKALVQLIDTVSGQIVVHPHGSEIISIMKDCYKEGVTIEQATLQLVHQLFNQYGLLVLLPDDAALKQLYIPVIAKELTTQFSQHCVAETVKAFPAAYKIQASGREINLFYLHGDRRDRIELDNGQYIVHGTTITFSKEAILDQLQQHPECFSPNVILRPAFQETVLPNVAFIGGGGELAYWMELKKVFEAVDVPYPALVLRNSYMLLEEAQQQKIKQMGFDAADLFKTETELINRFVKRESQLQLSLTKEKEALQEIYQSLKNISGAVDVTLVKHTEALQAKALQRIAILEKKMLKAEKKKFEAQQRQLYKLKAALFPNNNLQERVENMMPYYAKWGAAFINVLYQHALALEQEMVLLLQQ